MTNEEEEKINDEAMELERKLTFYQVLLMISLASGKMQHTEFKEPEGETSQMLELERMGIVAAEQGPGETVLRLTAKGKVMAGWFGGVMLETLGVDPAFL